MRKSIHCLHCTDTPFLAPARNRSLGLFLAQAGEPGGWHSLLIGRQVHRLLELRAAVRRFAAGRQEERLIDQAGVDVRDRIAVRGEACFTQLKSSINA